jgi:hypothetical protein
MKDATLLQRVDSKYVMTVDQLLDALADLGNDYKVLEIDGRRIHRYQTLYFDTPDLSCYLQHHNGWRPRYKVRSRTYLDTETSYLEVKRKNNRGVTVKSRLPIAGIGTIPAMTKQLERSAGNFVADHCPLPIDQLNPTIWNTFRRVTLVGRDDVERVTLDVDLFLGYGDAQMSLAGIAVAEVKQEHHSLCSAFIDRMRSLGLRPMSFSKYCVGVNLFYRGVKRNRFKPMLRYLDTLLKESDFSWKI